MQLKFKKLSNRWFVDIPYDGSVDDLQMVSGADLMLESIANGNETVVVRVSRTKIAHSVELSILESDDVGATYFVDNWDNEECTYRGNVWLCNVTKLVFGDFPSHIYLTF